MRSTVLSLPPQLIFPVFVLHKDELPLAVVILMYKKRLVSRISRIIKSKFITEDQFTKHINITTK
jgi:hypothetical protein